MASVNPFRPQGNTQLIAPTTTASASLQVSTGQVSGCRVNNLSTTVIWVAFGTSTIAALTPTTAVPANAFPMAAGGIETFDTSPIAYISAISSGGTGLVSVTPGFGQ